MLTQSNLELFAGLATSVLIATFSFTREECAKPEDPLPVTLDGDVGRFADCIDEKYDWLGENCPEES